MPRVQQRRRAGLAGSRWSFVSPQVLASRTFVGRFRRVSGWCCQTNANSSRFLSDEVLLGVKKAEPLNEGCRAGLLERVAGWVGAVLVDMVVDRGVGGCRTSAMFSRDTSAASPAPAFEMADANSQRDCSPNARLLPVTDANEPHSRTVGP